MRTIIRTDCVWLYAISYGHSESPMAIGLVARRVQNSSELYAVEDRLLNETGQPSLQRDVCTHFVEIRDTWESMSRSENP